VTNVGDLGRRVAERRHELGLSEAEVADRAGMHPSYLELVEHSASSQLTRSALLRLSAALETTAEALSGGGFLAPPGHALPLARPILEPLGYDECQGLISAGGVGRLVFTEFGRPVAIPVQFKMLGGDVVFRTAASTSFDAAVEVGVVSFEVDRIDDALAEGWSVLLSGEVHVISDARELKLAQDLKVTPWAGGERDIYVRIATQRVTGRRVRHV